MNAKLKQSTDLTNVAHLRTADMSNAFLKNADLRNADMPALTMAYMPPASIAYASEVKPHWYVFEAEIDDDLVSIEYYDENYCEQESPMLKKQIHVKSLTNFIENYYVAYQDDNRTSLEYLQENIFEVVTDFLNKSKGLNHA